MENSYPWIALVASVISLIILYYIIKEAVKNGILEAWKELKPPQVINKKDLIPDANWTNEQKDLLMKYERGEISFEEYQKMFNNK